LTGCAPTAAVRSRCARSVVFPPTVHEAERVVFPLSSAHMRRGAIGMEVCVDAHHLSRKLQAHVTCADGANDRRCMSGINGTSSNSTFTVAEPGRANTVLQGDPPIYHCSSRSRTTIRSPGTSQAKGRQSKRVRPLEREPHAWNQTLGRTPGSPRGNTSRRPRFARGAERKNASLPRRLETLITGRL
jgi:hypothetical protein